MARRPGEPRSGRHSGERVQQQATEGDIHWLLVNGNMKKGMPSWAKLPDPQLWQVITYVKSLH
jgi:mono/diheme cytochrome c family protein